MKNLFSLLNYITTIKSDQMLHLFHINQSINNNNYNNNNK